MKPRSHPSIRSSPSRWPLILISAGVVLLILVAVLALAPPVSAPTPTQPAAVAQEDIPRATLSEAKAAYDAGSALFVDVRDAESYAASHIAGAASFPLIQLDQNLGQLDKTKWIITYCT